MTQLEFTGEQNSPSTSMGRETLLPLLKKILNKSKSSHLLRVDQSSNEIKLKGDKQHLGLIYLEAPYIQLPHFDLLKLIERGKCCSYCGKVLKIYDNGKMKDDGNKANRQKQTAMDKHERYINGLDCSDCEIRWCDKQCRDLDFKHVLLNHRPSNKSATHTFIDVNNNEKDVFYFDRWTKLKNKLVETNQDLIYNTLMCILHIYYDDQLKCGYESLNCYKSTDDKELEKYVKSWNLADDINLNAIRQQFCSCFKNYDISYTNFLKYIIIFRLNNYNGSIYLIFSVLNKSSTVEPNVKVDYYDGQTNHDYEEFSVVPGGNNDICLVKEHVVDNTKVKPIYTNKTSGIIDKKIIQIVNTAKLTSSSSLVLLEEDYSNPLDKCDDEIEFISDVEFGQTIPKLVVPLSPAINPSNTMKNNKVRAASFTSSGASFGEGIIKYNRDQIREMLENMSHSNRVDEVSSDEADEAIIDEVSTSVGSSLNTNIVSMVKNMQLNNAASQRRKSVKFEEEVTTI